MDIREIIMLILGIGWLYLIYRFFNWLDRKKIYLKNNGIPSTAKILTIRDTLISYGDSIDTDKLWEFRLEIKSSDNVKREVTTKQSYRKSIVPKVGDEVDILVDPKNPDNVMIVRDNP